MSNVSELSLENHDHVTRDTRFVFEFDVILPDYLTIERYMLGGIRYIWLAGYIAQTSCLVVNIEGQLKLGLRLETADGSFIVECRADIHDDILLKGSYVAFEALIKVPQCSDKLLEQANLIIDFLLEERYWFGDVDKNLPRRFVCGSKSAFSLNFDVISLTKEKDLFGEIARSISNSEHNIYNASSYKNIIEAIHLCHIALSCPDVTAQNRYKFEEIQNANIKQICAYIKLMHSDNNFHTSLDNQDIFILFLTLIRRKYDYEIMKILTQSWRHIKDITLRKIAVRYFTNAREDSTWGWIFNNNHFEAKKRIIDNVIIPFVDTKNSEHYSDFKLLSDLQIKDGLINGVTPTIDKIYHVLKNKSVDLEYGLENNLDSTCVDTTGFVDDNISIAKFLSYSAPEFLQDVINNYSFHEFTKVLPALRRLVPIYLIITKIGYPMGGGESFMHQTCRILSEFGVKCIWLSFADSKFIDYESESVTITPFYVDIRYAGGMSHENISRAIRDLAPDVIHTQGISNGIVEEVASEFRIPTLVGFHFWSGLVSLGPTGNKNILKNSASISVDIKRNNKPFIVRYLASKFMQDVYAAAGGREPFEIIHPVSDPAHYLVETLNHQNIERRKYVLQINIVKLKGGEILLHCIKEIGSRVPFYVVESEPGPIEHFENIREAIHTSPDGVYCKYGDIKNFYSEARLVIVPTLVDETFCRVAFEAAMNGIPVISTRNGFLPDMMGEDGLYLDEEPNSWSEKIEELYFDEEKLISIGRRQQERLSKRFGYYPRQFIESFFKCVAMSPRRNIGFVSTWGDQGLGNQVKLYSEILMKVGFHTHILSFQAYASRDLSLKNQHFSADWDVGVFANSVYYSLNDRENITINEIEQFIVINCVGPVIYPEICWAINWSKIFDVNIVNAFFCAVPNIETIRRSEIEYHNRMTSTFYNTRIAQNILRSAGVKNGIYIGHGVGNSLAQAQLDAKIENLKNRRKIRYCHVGGHNPVSRKQTHLVLAAFQSVAAIRDDVELILTSMVPISSYINGSQKSITVINKTLRHEEIIDLYRKSDVSIQVSSHEGLGLGFYESIATATPVISLDVPPHNEPVVDGVTGWLLPAKFHRLPDNDDGVVEAAQFDPADLMNLILSLNIDDVAERINTTHKAHAARYSETSFATRLISAMP
ncbi:MULTISPECIES: glycosyltransferase family 4 protein [Methylobacterium]|uniref:Glycosyltransferase n=2 Tax=Methylobacterium TaxID=407 RepID=A0A0C6FPC5_9HYPH|nr:glycosyltransferase [Methylobacterium aquaticum]BAQ50173.1 glycosyltransferase [Methylobacterium aquaticum]